MNSLILLASLALMASPALAQEAEQSEDELVLPPIVMSTQFPNEEAVDPYEESSAHAGTPPFEGVAMLDAFHGRPGIDRIVDNLVGRSEADPRTAGVFQAHDLVRLRRTLKEQFCYILNGGCDYTGRDMQTAHRDIGLQAADMGALVENLQLAMEAEGVAFRAQNRFLAKLAPMKRDIVTR